MALSIKELIEKYPPPWHVRMCGEIIQSNTGVWVCEANGAATSIVEMANSYQKLKDVLKDIVDHASGTLEMDDGEKGYAVHSDFIFAAEELLK